MARSAFVFLLALAAGSGCKSPDPGPSHARADIEKANARFSEAFEQGNAEAIAALYTQDAIVFPPGGEMVKGRESIGGFWKTTRESGIKSAKLTTLDVGESGDLAYEVGTVVLAVQPEGKESSTAKAKYVVVWQRQKDGSWKMHQDIWNDLPSSGS